ncbi:MAG: hypothetical protein K8R67_02820 [Desulfobacteraceae bacterium]|nr:hypothetical protein [Desulfobacteraceae bacterium]
MEITITSQQFNNDKLIEELENMPNWGTHNIELILKKKETSPRTGIDPTILTAILSSSATSAALVALVSGLLNVLKQAKTQKIVIRDKDGIIVEFPADYPIEKIKKMLDVVNDIMNSPQIEL